MRLRARASSAGSAIAGVCDSDRDPPFCLERSPKNSSPTYADAPYDFAKSRRARAGHMRPELRHKSPDADGIYQNRPNRWGFRRERPNPTRMRLTKILAIYLDPDGIYRRPHRSTARFSASGFPTISPSPRRQRNSLRYWAFRRRGAPFPGPLRRIYSGSRLRFCRRRYCFCSPGVSVSPCLVLGPAFRGCFGGGTCRFSDFLGSRLGVTRRGVTRRRPAVGIVNIKRSTI